MLRFFEYGTGNVVWVNPAAIATVTETVAPGAARVVTLRIPGLDPLVVHDAARDAVDRIWLAGPADFSEPREPDANDEV